jgi:putative addiction module component (TIGR02574 family)
MSPAKQHLEALLKLPAEERSAAAEVLLESLEDDEESDPASAAAWAAEIQRRIDDNAPGIPADEVFAELRARFRTKE